MNKNIRVRKVTDWFLVVIMNAGKYGIIGIRDGGDGVNRNGERERERDDYCYYKSIQYTVYSNNILTIHLLLYCNNNDKPS